MISNENVLYVDMRTFCGIKKYLFLLVLFLNSMTFGSVFIDYLAPYSIQNQTKEPIQLSVLNDLLDQLRTAMAKNQNQDVTSLIQQLQLFEIFSVSLAHKNSPNQFIRKLDALILQLLLKGKFSKLQFPTSIDLKLREWLIKYIGTEVRIYQNRYAIFKLLYIFLENVQQHFQGNVGNPAIVLFGEYTDEVEKYGFICVMTASDYDVQEAINFYGKRGPGTRQGQGISVGIPFIIETESDYFYFDFRLASRDKEWTFDDRYGWVDTHRLPSNINFQGSLSLVFFKPVFELSIHDDFDDNPIIMEQSA